MACEREASIGASRFILDQDYFYLIIIIRLIR